jgi:hypothetical protein
MPSDEMNVSVREIEVRVAQVGWDREENRIPIILLGREKRQAIGMYASGVACVWTPADPMRKIMVRVFRQYRDKLEAATINHALSSVLNVQEGANVCVGVVHIGGPNDNRENERQAGQTGQG